MQGKHPPAPNALTVATDERIAAWERQDAESELSWKGFTYFRDGPRPRQLELTARFLRIPLHEAVKLAGDNGWRDRAVAFDRYLDAYLVAERMEVLAEDDRQRTAEQLRVTITSRELVLSELRKQLLVARASETSTMRMADLIKLIETSIKMDRLVRGEATEILSTKAAPLNFDHLTDEELAALEKGLGRDPDEFIGEVVEVPDPASK